MNYANKTIVGTWNVTGKPLVLRNWDNGETFWMTEAKEGPSESADVFVLRDADILDRSDITLVAGVDVEAVKALIIASTWPEGSVAGPQGLGRKEVPTNFVIPDGYAKLILEDGTIAFKKANTTPSTQKVAASAEAPVGFFKKNLKWIIGGVVVVAGVLVAVFSGKKGKKARR